MEHTGIFTILRLICGSRKRFVPLFSPCSSSFVLIHLRAKTIFYNYKPSCRNRFCSKKARLDFKRNFFLCCLSIVYSKVFSDEIVMDNAKSSSNSNAKAAL
ncbi:hypothetical protein QYF36_004204 [Acer negundo]|nr:hypothetical protein QYF36_004204 [Acer negundo]